MFDRSAVGAMTASAPTAFDDSGEALALGVRSFPRHFFSSHSTQSTRPSDMGNPHAWHLRRFLKTAGTLLRSASADWGFSIVGLSASDQKSGFLGADGLARAEAADADVSTAAIGGLSDWPSTAVKACICGTRTDGWEG